MIKVGWQESWEVNGDTLYLAVTIKCHYLVGTLIDSEAPVLVLFHFPEREKDACRFPRHLLLCPDNMKC